MPKHFNPLSGVTVTVPPLPLADMARRGIRVMQQHLSRPDLRSDVRENARRELHRWRGILLKGKALD